MRVPIKKPQRSASFFIGKLNKYYKMKKASKSKDRPFSTYNYDNLHRRIKTSL